MYSIILREIKSYIKSVSIYLASLFFLISSSIWYFLFIKIQSLGKADLTDYFIIYPSLYCILISAITMKSFSEELRNGTYELLVTFPLTELEIVCGKFFSSFFVLLFILFFTLPIPLLISLLGSFDIGVVFTQYLGVILLGCICISIGQFISCNTKNQISSFLITIALLLVIIFMGIIDELTPGGYFTFINWISLKYHFESFNKGIIDFRDIVYYITTTVFFLFLTKEKIIYKKYN